MARPIPTVCLATLAAVALWGCGDDEATTSGSGDGASATTSSDDAGDQTNPAGGGLCTATGSVTGGLELTFADAPVHVTAVVDAGTPSAVYSIRVDETTIVMGGGADNSVAVSNADVGFGGETEGAAPDGSGADVDVDLEAFGGGGTAHLTVTVVCD